MVIRFVRSPWTRLAIFVLLLGGAAWFAVGHGASSVSVAREWVAGAGLLGAAAFVFVYAGATMAILPAGVLSAAGGVLYGPVLGVAVVWLGATLGATLSFLIGRVLSRGVVQRLTGGRIDRLDRFLAGHGGRAVLLVRLVPLFPFALINYGCPLTAITLRQYLWGTAIGILPGSIVYTTLGGSITDPTSAAFIAVAIALALLSIGGAAIARKIARRERPDSGR